MSQNPLQQYFRQPKVYIGLPSLGVYNRNGTIQGDASNMPVYGMTGMDEILMKTPDALMSGESVVKVVESCCPVIKDGWEVSMLDINLILIAIRIATHGNKLDIDHTCKSCGAENSYNVDLSSMIDHYSSFKYSNKLVLGDLIVNLRPITYRQAAQFSIKNFELQQKMAQAGQILDVAEQKDVISSLFTELAEMQTEIFVTSIESVTIDSTVVTEKEYIKEWLSNCDGEFFDQVKNHINKIRDDLQIPGFKIKCDTCGTEDEIFVDMDQSNFFEKA